MRDVRLDGVESRIANMHEDLRYCVSYQFVGPFITKKNQLTCNETIVLKQAFYLKGQVGACAPRQPQWQHWGWLLSASL